MIDIEDACDEVWSGTNGEELCEHRACAGCHYLIGAAVAFGLMGMAEAIRSRPRYTWRVVVNNGRMASHSWYTSEAKAIESAASLQTILGALTVVEITKQEVERCDVCA